MEGAGGDAVAQAERPQPVGELAGGLAGEGEREHVAGVELAGERPVGDAAGEHPGLARAGAGEDAQRAWSVAVTAWRCCVVEAVEQICVRRSTGTVRTLTITAAVRKVPIPAPCRYSARTSCCATSEELVLDLHPHWWYFASVVIAAVVAFIVGDRWCWPTVDIGDWCKHRRRPR